MRPLQNDCTYCTQLFFVAENTHLRKIPSPKRPIAETSRRRNFLSPKRPVAELAVAETSCRRNGGRRTGVAEWASPKRPIPYLKSVRYRPSLQAT